MKEAPVLRWLNEKDIFTYNVLCTPSSHIFGKISYGKQSCVSLL